MTARPLEIAFVAQDFPPEVGGTHVYNAEYARRLHERGHRLRVFTWKTTAPESVEADSGQPFEVYREPLRRRGRGIDPGGVAREIARWRPDVAFVSGGSGAMSRVVRATARAVPTCVSVHDLRDKGRDRGALGRWRVRRRYGFDRAARLTANSEHTRDRLLRLGVPAERVAIVHPGVDASRFTPDPAAGAALRLRLGLERATVLLTVSRLAPNKGHARVIDLLPRLVRLCPDLVYVVVGEGSLRAELEARAASLGVSERVHFAGRVEDVRPWYNACDVFVMASSRHGSGTKAGEGFGIAYVEASACGKPVVASSSGGGREVVADGTTGRVVDPDDADALEAALRELLGDPELARRLGARGRERVTRFDWSRGVERLERVLREAAAVGAARGDPPDRPLPALQSDASDPGS